jgi:hypothetical protein
MPRTPMFREPLERYLANKILVDGKMRIETVRIRRIENAEPDGCNWDIDAIEPAVSDDAMQGIIRSIVRELRAAIIVQEWSGSDSRRSTTPSRAHVRLIGSG